MLKSVIALVTSSALLLGCATMPDSPADQGPEAEAVKLVVLEYFQGQGQASEERLERAFARNHAIMMTSTVRSDGTNSVRRTEMDDVISTWVSNENPPGLRSDYEFLSLQIVENRLATVTFRSGTRFFDALTLMKIDNEWKIVTKVYVPQSPN